MDKKATTTPSENQLWSIREVAAMTSFSAKLIRNKVVEGKIPALDMNKSGKRPTWRISSSTLHKLLAGELG